MAVPSNQALQAMLQQALADNVAAYAKLCINPRPDGSIDGESNQWNALRKSLLEEQLSLLKQIQALDGAFEVTTYAPGY